MTDLNPSQDTQPKQRDKMWFFDADLHQRLGHIYVNLSFYIQYAEWRRVLYVLMTCAHVCLRGSVG